MQVDKSTFASYQAHPSGRGVIGFPLYSDQIVGTGKENTNVDALIGETGQVIAPINPMEIGQVKLKGQIWSAIADDQLLTIEEGSYVTVKAIEGVKLIVIPKV